MGTSVDGRMGGALITGVEPGSPAARAGVRAGEVLREIDGVPVADLIDYLYPSEVVQKSDSQPQFLKIEKKRGPGRPRLGGVQ